jgi:hypothetical protein
MGWWEFCTRELPWIISIICCGATIIYMNRLIDRLRASQTRLENEAAKGNELLLRMNTKIELLRVQKYELNKKNGLLMHELRVQHVEEKKEAGRFDGVG